MFAWCLLGTELLYFTGSDFVRVEREARTELKRSGFKPKQVKSWRVTTGLTDSPLASLQDALADLRESKDPAALIVHHPRFHLDDPTVIQGIIDAYAALKRRRSQLVFIGADIEFPPELQSIVTVIKRGPRETGSILELVTHPERLENLGGFGAFKEWLNLRRLAFTSKARSYGITPPRGILLVGIPGTGKSLAAKTLGAFFGLSAYRFDIGRVYSPFVGESETRIRTTLRTAEDLAPCILWIDEIERGLAGHDSSGELSAGVTPHVMGTILTWLAENTAPVFLVATVNDIRALPLTLYRRGRLNEVWAVGLPDDDARKEIFKIHLARRKRDCERFDVEMLVQQSEGFTGAEIESLIEDAMLLGFAEKREFTTEDVSTCATHLIPQSKRNREEMQKLETWMHANARPVNG